jgi:hypothetical protein
MAGREQMPTVSFPRRLTTSSAAIPVSDPVLEPPLKQANNPTFGNVIFLYAFIRKYFNF